MNLFLIFAALYFLFSYLFGIYYIYTCHDIIEGQKFNFYSLIDKKNLFFIFIIAPIIFWIMTLAIIGFYLFLGGAGLIGKIEENRERKEKLNYGSK